MRNGSFLIVENAVRMLATSERLLRLLALLQARRDWNGPKLADELGVTTRTVRKDVERLRALGYPVHADPGAAGGYQLGAGTALPPLLLEDDEAVAIALGLRAAAANGGVAGMEETALRALAKLEHVLPSALRRRVGALHRATAAVAGGRGSGGPSVEPGDLSAIAAAVEARRRLNFDYAVRDGATALRSVEPQRLVHASGRWYLVAWDVERDDWRTFRVDRMRLRAHEGARFARRADPGGDAADYVRRGLRDATWKHRARVTVHAPAAEVAARVPADVVVEVLDEASCAVHVGSDSPRQLALWLGLIDADFAAGHDPALARELRLLADRYLRAAEQPA